jgi:hypothetical protein
VGNPRFYRHPYQSPQQELWQAGSVEWFVIIRNALPVRRRKRKSRLVVMQLHCFLMALRGNHKNVPLPQRMEARKFLTNVARNSRQPSGLILDVHSS